MPSLLTLTDVMGTGHHAAVAAEVGPGKTVAVVGDGAVGLCGVIASKRLGAERIILLGSNPERTALGQEFGATDVVRERGEEAVERVRELTEHGAHSVLECVGLEQAVETALEIARPGGAVRSSWRARARHDPHRHRVLEERLDVPAAPHPCARTSRSCCRTCSKVGSSQAVSSTAPARSRTCRTATAR